MTPPATRSPSSSPAAGSDPRDARRRGRRRGLVAAGAAIVLVAVVVGALVVAGVFDGSSGSGAGDGSDAAPKAVTDVTVTAGATSVEAPLLFTRFPDGVSEQVMGTLTRYVDDGIVAALRTGRADAADLPNVLDAGVTAQLAGADRAVLFDEGLPPAVGKVSVAAPPVPLSALVGVDGKAVIVIAGVELDVTAATKRGPVHITRRGNLQFAPDASGAWRVTGYDLTVDRDGRGLPTGTPSTTKGSK